MRLQKAILASATLALALPALAQFPTQYPGGQYPTGQYPPSTYPGGYPPNTYPQGGTYPPGSYPPNTYPDSYPTRLPGGVPINLPVPNVKLPGKKDPKEKPGSARQEQSQTLSPVDGVLRRLREKDLVLETSHKAILRFRLLAKTRLENKAGEPVRESLIHPGDQISVMVSPDDPETAIRVVQVRAGDPRERASAEKPIDEAAVREPRAEDLGKPRTVVSEAPAPTIEEDAKPASPGPATASAPAENTAAEPDSLAPKSSGPATDAGMIAGAREAASTFTATLPNYLVQQLTIRYFSPSSPPRWQLLDQVTADLAYVDGKEDYRNFRIDGKPIERPEQSGTWSTGEFSTTLEDILALNTNASFRRRGEQKMAGRNAIVFDYSVAQPNSHWTVVSPDDRRYNPPFEGAIWIDQDTHRVLRIEQRTTSMPRDWPFKGVEWVLEYGYVKIEQKTYLLPERAENIGCMSGSGACTRNVIEFRNYRKFTTESNVKFGQ